MQAEQQLKKVAAAEVQAGHLKKLHLLHFHSLHVYEEQEAAEVFSSLSSPQVD